MKRALFLLTLAQPVFAYTYYYSDAFGSLNSSAWTQNGSVAVGAGLSAPDAEGGSLISLLAVPGADPREHEVKITLTLPAAGGTYVSYLNATPDARIGATTATGSFYAVEISPGAVSATGGGWAMLRVRKSIGGVVTDLIVTSVPCRNGTVVRSIYRSGVVWVYVDDVFSTNPVDGEVPTGRPGVGAYGTPAGGNVSALFLGLREGVAPGAVDASKIGSYVLPNEVQFQWAGAQDDPRGSGLHSYVIYRDGQYAGWTRGAVFVDATVAPGATYNYAFYTLDFHRNALGPTMVQVSTPPAGAIDPRRVGVRPTGAYWGAMGEQLDMFSGNLNVSVPLLKAMARGGWSVPISLSYNSQIWRFHSNQNWLLGRDVGYGFGWRLMAGSLIPEWSDYFTVHHYTFTDAGGAEYRLDVNNNGIWSSRQGTYVSYDAANERLYWPDGTFWVMRCVSSGLEEDAGTLYPTIIHDTNGNEVFIRYKAGLGSVYGADSSARIEDVQDVRALPYVNRRVTYTFSYDASGHLTHIMNVIGTAENFTFAYLPGQPLYSPFNSQPFGTVTLLQSLSNSIPHTHSFEYSGNLGELTRVIFPYGGDLRWAYRGYTYYGAQTLREVQYRYLSKSAGAPLNTYTFVRDDSGGAYHAWAALQNPGGTGEKAWWFNSGGLNTAYEDRLAPGQPAMRRQDFTWTQDAAGTPYIGTALTTLDPGTAWQAQFKTEQSLDTHGSVVWTKLYDYGNLSTPARTYNHTYLTNANYTSRFMFNRAVTSTVTPAGGGPITLFTNYYDNYGGCGPFAQGPVGGLVDFDPAYATLLYRGNVAYRATPNGSMCYVRDGLGTVRTQTDGAGHATTSNSSASTNYAVPAAISGGGVTNTFAYTAFLGIASVSEANGSASLFSYDAGARPTETTSPHGAKTTYSYTTSPPTSTATTNGRFVRTSYDGLGRTIKVERGDTATRSVVDTEYDVCACSPIGKVKRVSQAYAPGGPVYWTTYNYDGLGRLLSVVAPDGASTGGYAYQGRSTTVTDPAGKWKKFTTDAMGNLVQVTEPNPAGGANFETYYTYDALNNLTQVAMPRNGYTQTRTFAYQGNLVTSATNPENGTTTYTYHGDGSLATRTDAAGRRYEYSYDSYDRLTLERVIVRNQYNQWVENGRKEYQYDTNNIDPSVSEYASGRLAAAIHGNVTYLYGYTRGGLIKTKQMRYLEEPLTATWTYDDEGKMTTVTYPSGSLFTYGYDSMGRPNTLTGRRWYQYQTQSLVTGAQYNAAGQLSR